MTKLLRPTLALALVAAGLSLVSVASAAEPTASADPAKMPRTGVVDERFQSYNIEMIEVTGGRFWKPYASQTSKPAEPSASDSASTPAGLPADLYEYRPPIDLSNTRLRKLAAALGPVYVRVSGTWANTVYFHDSDDSAPQEIPVGFKGVLTRKQWKGVIDFAHATGGKLVTSFAFGAGNRTADGTWTPDQARRLLEYTRAAGGSIASAEFMNEPNFAAMGGAPKGYDAAAYGRDVDAFRRFFRGAAPGSLFAGPGSTGEGGVLAGAPMPAKLTTENLLKATGPAFDVFSYHIYTAVSKRCAASMPAIGTTAAAALSQEWLSRPGKEHAFYAGLRDRFEPGKPLWVTETADTACGGNPWASTFLDTFRYLNQNGRLAQQGVQMVAHNTLAASDYGLLDEKTFSPRPNYWGALLWRRLMGSVVLKPAASPNQDLHLYAHCTPHRPGGVSVLAINASHASQDFEMPLAGQRYTLTAKELESTTVQLNGRELKLGAGDAWPVIEGVSTRPGNLRLAPASITFFSFPEAKNKACY